MTSISSKHSAGTIKKSFASSSTSSAAAGDSDAEFKVPLTPFSMRTLSGAPMTPVPPIPKACTNFGMAGTAGVVVSIVLYMIDLGTDAVLLWSFWNQTEEAAIHYISEVWDRRFYVTLGIILVPTVLINIISLILYGRMEKRTEGEQVLYHGGGKCKKILSITLHLCQLGMLVRYLDLIKCGRNLLRGKMRGAPPHTRPRTPILAPMRDLSKEDVLEDMAYIRRLSKESYMIDILYNHLKNSSQLVYLIFLVYRSRIAFEMDVLQWKITVGIQLGKIFICLCSVTWSHVSFQEEFRRSHLDVRQLRCRSIALCCMWRWAFIGSRVLSIASFSALRATPEGGLIKVDEYYYSQNLLFSFPLIMALIVVAHWLIMLIWIHSQRSNWCARDEGSGRNEFCEFLFSMAMAWVYNFDYVNLKESLARKRMVFFYTLIAIEDTTLMVLFNLQLISVDLWLRVLVVLLMEFLCLIGLSCCIGYYAFIHPTRNKMETAFT